MKEIIAIFVVLLVVALIVLGPLAAIWSLNTLFHTNIDYTWQTWLAALVLGGAVRSTVYSSSKD